MLKINQLKLRVGHNTDEMNRKIASVLGIRITDIKKVDIMRQSLDARHKPELFYVYTVDVSVADEKAVLKKINSKKHKEDILLCDNKNYLFPEAGEEQLKRRPVVVGCGPAGLFCAYFLALNGYCPIVVEQGAPVEERMNDVEEFWKTGVLNPDSNVQFGEGGAGTFSDGKLNTLIKDPIGRNRKVLEIFVKYGAPEDILYVNKPHIGTDILCRVIANMRNAIISMGGEFHFHTRMEELIMNDDHSLLKGFYYTEKGKKELLKMDTQIMILAPGHSARKLFEKLYEQEIPMEQKAFAVGVRVEHPQEMINVSQYGENYPDLLPSAAYKLTAKSSDGRGVYSFCMCPGGYVVNASSEEGYLAVNGMSLRARDTANANSAIVVGISKEDFESDHPLAGISFQRKLEKAAFEAGGGRIPVQYYGDFYRDVTGKELTTRYADVEKVKPCMKGEYTFTSLKDILPAAVSRGIVEGMKQFDDKIHGFLTPNAVMAAVESRTSSPLRILRDKTLESTVGGLYPCGEGAGYAGGITSAAVDGIKVAEMIRKKYAEFDKTQRF